ncbi:MAG: glycosyltransferase [Moraxellaceae bacterium]|nr:MAG: glycosyltransferase [Moraxellaceae bacterium]
MNQAFTPITPTDKVLCLGGFPIISATSRDVESRIGKTLDTEEKFALFFANTNFVVQCQYLKDEMLKKPTMIINDGIGLDIAAKLIHGEKFPENLAGTDFLPALLHNGKDNIRVFLFGAKPGIAARGAQTLRTEYGVNVVGTADGYGEARDLPKLIATINASKANLIFVAMGNPLQEEWIVKHRDELNANVMIGVGAFLDFLAGDKPRAPELIRKLRLEWFYRLCLEPTRLMRRYTIDIAKFLAICFRTGKESHAPGIN